MSISDIAKSVKGGLLDSLRAVRDALPDIAQQAEINAAREAVQNGVPAEQAIQGNGERKKELVMFMLSLFLGSTAMNNWSGLIGMVVDIGVAVLKRAGKLRKPTPDDLADVQMGPAEPAA